MILNVRRIGSGLNPYRPVRLDSSKIVGSSHFVLNPIFPILWIAGWCGFTTALIYLIDLAWPIPLVDRAFFFRLYASIGAVAGLLSWFSARLVALSRLRFGVLVVLLLPLLLVFFVAIQLNPLVAGLTGIYAFSTLVLAWEAGRVKPASDGNPQKIDELYDDTDRRGLLS